MLSRLLTLATARNFYNLRPNVIMTQHHVALNKLYEIRAQPLHVKVSDAEAGLNIQREANRIKHIRNDKQNEDVINRKRNIAQSSVKNAEEVLQKNALPVQVESRDADLFGGALKTPPPEDEGDKVEEEYISRPTRHSKKLRTKEYADIIKDHLKQHRINEAINVLEVRMLKEDRVKPENYIYNLLISGCAKAGYTRKAFQLYTKMRQRGLKVKESTYTSLFNACANAPSRLDGLTTAKRLRENLLEKEYEANVVNYNAMIKAFGRWGDVQTAYMLADEMVDKKLELMGDTYNFLLQACASDPELGFRHALVTWHKMLAQGIQPDYYTFNAILRCTRDCGFGDLESMEKVLNEILSGNTTIRLTGTNSETPKQFLNAKDVSVKEDKENAKSILNISAQQSKENESSASSVSVTGSQSSNTLEIHTDATSLELPNLLASKPHLGSMVSLAEVSKAHERFLLLGGLHGFLQLMKSVNITPDIQTFTTLLEVVPPTNAAEKQIITYIRKIGLKADIDFFNILIKKRAMRFDYEGGKEVLSMIRTAGLYPDIVTFGVLALGCKTVEESRELLQQMRQHNIRMNIQILGAMLRQGCVQRSFPYICEIMQTSLDENIKPNDVFLKHLHKFYMDCARAIDARHKSAKDPMYRKQHRQFCEKYRIYKEEHGIDALKLQDAIKKIRERPYDQYKEEPIVGLEPLKNENLAQKQKLRKYIKKIKVQSLKGDEETKPHLLQQINTVAPPSEEGSSFNKEEPPASAPPVTNNPFR